MKLYTSPTSPFCRTVEVVAHELGLMDDIERLPTKAMPTQGDPAFRQVTPLRRIPALDAGDGLVIVDSTVIAEYLCARVGDHAMFGRDGGDHWRMMTDYVHARGIAEAGVQGRYESAVRPDEKRWDAWLDDQMDKIDAILARFDGAPPAATGRLTIVDVMLGVALGYLDFRYADFGWRQRHAALADWAEPVLARPSFEATRPG
ncbi:glutathione S-transferase family protein [Acuticoccus sp.]|uniref:glutathione S-transferase family protein n=1 Tax=Acuticoccus sp. TaxID=1904378 RepID=UPI003B51C28E